MLPTEPGRAIVTGPATEETAALERGTSANGASTLHKPERLMVIQGGNSAQSPRGKFARESMQEALPPIAQRLEIPPITRGGCCPKPAHNAICKPNTKPPQVAPAANWKGRLEKPRSKIASALGSSLMREVEI
eukprot:CAMPEP_0169073756 /NCGR_PEP_ID=MMETSP1015-20121227/6911_1 /TAXON_ID=342587 /ORGANISM="Karlodinium micrum, Strain CCMP2283" /LENGTH=132 /DNA_ID=CAMNT_0009133027 /DNA_START=82 /DNA_END=480 /DNA_ORIENTATION=-